MTTFVHIGDAVTFSTNNGVWLHEACLAMTPEELRSAVQTAFDHVNDPLLMEACCGGCGPLAAYSDLMFDEYLLLIEEERIKQAGLEAKRILTRERRNQFNARRPELVLAMIDAGIPYVCAHPGCKESIQLTVDHVTPLSRGGNDELSNLQFLCKTHNSVKCDKPPT